MPVARPKSLLTGENMKISWSANWDDNLGGSLETMQDDPILKKMSESVKAEFEKAFMFYLPRICEHCLNPSCVASCPFRCDVQACRRRYRAGRPGRVPRLAHVRVGVPVQEGLLQPQDRQGREVHDVLPAHRSGTPPVCSETCVGRLRYLGASSAEASTPQHPPSSPAPTSSPTARAHQASAEVLYTREFLPSVNDPTATDAAIRAAAHVGQSDAEGAPVMASEDFGVYADHVPANFTFIGNGLAGHPGGIPLHSHDYDFNDALLPAGIRYYQALASGTTVRR